MRTVIVFSALSETTIPWRTLRVPSTGACTGASGSGAGAAARRAAGFARSRRGRAGRRSALAPPSAPPPAFGHPLGMALLGSAGRPGLAGVPRPCPAAALLGRDLLDGLGGGGRRGLLCGRCLGFRSLCLGRRLRLRGLLGGLHRLLGRGLGCGRLSVSGLGGLRCVVVWFVSHVCSFARIYLVRSPRAGAVRSRTTVSARARSRRARAMPAVSSSSPVALAKRRPNTSLRSVVTRSASSESTMSRISLAFISEASVLAQHELGFHGQLVGRQADRVAGQRL